MASGGRAVCGAPHVPDLLSAVRAGAAGGVAGWRAGLSRSARSWARITMGWTVMMQDPDRWRVEILLQAKDDPSVLVPAEEVWRSNGDGLRRSATGSRTRRSGCSAGSVTRCDCGLTWSRRCARPPRPASI